MKKIKTEIILVSLLIFVVLFTVIFYHLPEIERTFSELNPQKDLRNYYNLSKLINEEYLIGNGIQSGKPQGNYPCDFEINYSNKYNFQISQKSDYCTARGNLRDHSTKIIFDSEDLEPLKIEDYPFLVCNNLSTSVCYGQIFSIKRGDGRTEIRWWGAYGGRPNCNYPELLDIINQYFTTCEDEYPHGSGGGLREYKGLKPHWLVNSTD